MNKAPKHLCTLCSPTIHSRFVSISFPCSFCYTMWRKIVMPWATRLSASPPPAEWPSSEVRRHITNLLVNNMCWSVEPATKRAEQWKRGSGRRLLNASAARLQRLFGAGVGDCLFEMVRTCGLQPQPTTSACDSGDRRWSPDADLTRRVFSFLWAAVTNLWVVYECLSAVSQGAQGPARGTFLSFGG